MARDVLQMTVGCNPSAPRLVRAALRQLADLEWESGDAMLVASELVANAVRHSGAKTGRVRVRVHSDHGRFRISVTDPGLSGRPAEPVSEARQLGGMGLRVVDALACDWGTVRRERGYEVWAELPRRAYG